jgi:aromatic ring-opening dioxygenase catalytic subunit (LigB family)
MIKHYGPESPLANFLGDLGPALLAKYQPKGILVFSAHWETQEEQLVTDYGDENPLLMDYYNFDPELYKLKFSSRGDTTLSKRVVELFQNVLLLPPHSFCSEKPRRPSHTQFLFFRLVSALV